VANLTNLGQEDARVTSLIVTGDVGTFSTPGVPANILREASRIFRVSVSIPGDAYAGNHTVTMTVHWQYYQSRTGNWIDALPLSVSGLLVVKSSGLPPSHGPSSPSDQAILRRFLLLLSNPYELAGLGGLLTMLVAAAIFRMNRRKHDSMDTSEGRTE